MLTLRVHKKSGVDHGGLALFFKLLAKPEVR
jgi:hypothetical protein